MEAYFLGHNGLGDNLTSISAIRFLLQFYEKIFFLCKDTFIENVKLFFLDTNNVECIQVSSCNEYNDCENIIMSKYNNYDIFIWGNCHLSYLKSKITNNKLLQYVNQDENICKNNCEPHILEYYNLIESFYNNINLNFNIYFNYWHLPSTDKSKILFNSVKKYYIIFLHTSSSTGEKIKIDNLLNKYLYCKNSILISIDNNFYNNINLNLLEDDVKENINEKKNICNNFLISNSCRIVYLLDTIINSDEIYVIDSCISCMILPLKQQNKLKTNLVKIILRKNINNIIL
jgi:hypothetical protein